MATLERRVQVLFDPVQYAALEEMARAEHLPVGAAVRQAVEDRTRRKRASREDALAGLLARADADPVPVDDDWGTVKASL